MENQELRHHSGSLHNYHDAPRVSKHDLAMLLLKTERSALSHSIGDARADPKLDSALAFREGTRAKGNIVQPPPNP
eukprot:3671923-Alexandrium_andersonii.AAC.1